VRPDAGVSRDDAAVCGRGSRVDARITGGRNVGNLASAGEERDESERQACAVEHGDQWNRKRGREEADAA